MDAELNSAAEAGNHAKLKELLRLVTPGPEDWLRKTLLRATYEGRAQAVETLLMVNADPSWVDERQEAALHWAARRGHEAIASLLLEVNANANQQTQDGTTALHLASELNAGSFVGLLLQSKADPTLATREKRVALHVAAENGCEAAAAKLLEPDIIYDDLPNPSLNLTNDRGETPLARACVRGKDAIVKQLLAMGPPAPVGKGADYELKNWWGHSPFFLSCQGGHVACVQQLIHVKADMDGCAKDGTSPLHAACERGHPKVVELLLYSSRGSIDKRANGGLTCVHSAALRGSSEVMRVLMRNHAKMECRTEEGRTPLSCAASRGHTDTCRILLENHADPQAIDTVKQTALHAAAATGKVDCVELLLKYRTRMDALDAAACSPIMLAHSNQQESVVRVLLKRGAELPEHLSNSAGMGDVVREVEQERLQEMVKESQEGKGSSLLKVAERDFEECRQRLLVLATRNASAYTAPAIHYLEQMVANMTANFKQTRQMEGQLSREAAKFRELLAAAQLKQDKADKDMKWCLGRAATAKQTMQRKQAAVKDMKKELTDEKVKLMKALQKSATLDNPLAQAESQERELRGEIQVLEKEQAMLEKDLEAVTARMKGWNEKRSQIAALHAQSQSLLDKDNITPRSTPRDSSKRESSKQSSSTQIEITAAA